MTFSKVRIHVALAALAGLGLRLFFVLRYPVTDSGDAPFYIELAWNWLKNGVYGFEVNGQLTPVDMRVPGLSRHSWRAIFACGGKFAARGDADAGRGGSCHLFSDRADRGTARSGSIAAARGDCGLVARGALSVYRELHALLCSRKSLVTFLTALAILNLA